MSEVRLKAGKERNSSVDMIELEDLPEEIGMWAALASRKVSWQL